MPSMEASFRNLILNQRIESVSAFVSPAVWQENGDPPSAPTADTVLNGALDLSAVHDLTAGVFVGNDGSVYPYSWLPEEGLAEKSRLDKVDYVGMVRDGFLLTTPGRAVSYDYVAQFLRRIFDDCKVGTIGFDRAYMRFLLPCLVRAGFSEAELAKFVEVGQGFLGMSPCIRELEVRLLEEEVEARHAPGAADGRDQCRSYYRRSGQSQIHEEKERWPHRSAGRPGHGG